MSTDNYAISTYTFTATETLNMDFIALGAHVVGPVEVILPENGYRPAEPSVESHETYFRVSLLSKLDLIDGALEGARYGRPRLLKLLSLLSFFTGHPYVPSESFEVSHLTIFGDLPEELKGLTSIGFTIHRFIINGHDFADDLRQFFDFGLQDTKNGILLFSLLERYRKAMFLLDEENELTVEESFLAYFHVLEALAQASKPERDKILKKKIYDFADDIIRNTLLMVGPEATEAIAEVSKFATSFTISSERFGIRSSILYTLDRLGIHDPITAELIRHLVQIRNAIAHARLVAQDREFIWPLPGFLSPLDIDDFEIASFLPTLVRRCIAALVGSSLGTDEWEDARSYLDPPAYVIRDFIINKRYLNLTPADFEAGAVAGVRPSSLVKYILKRDLKKTRLSTLVSVAGSYVQTAKATESNAYELFLLSILLADADEATVSTSARRHVIFINENDWSHYSNIKDALRELEVRDVQPLWFRKWLEEKGHISRITQHDEQLSGRPQVSGDQSTKNSEDEEIGQEDI